MSLLDPSSGSRIATTSIAMTVSDALAEGRRIMNVCNACRYCEGYCSVFPALERRLQFSDSDLRYLANLCHNCGECLTSCQYAPPHEFALNLPRNLAQIRADSYRRYAWPGVLAGMYDGGMRTAMLLAFMFSVLFLLGASRSVSTPAAFYDVISHSIMVLTFGTVGVFIVVALSWMFVRFWRDTGEPASSIDARAVGQALHDAATLRNLRGGGEGCAGGAGSPSGIRRFFHHATAYGFLLCFAATVVATWYHYGLHRPAPYPVASLPVLLGIVGGLGLLLGPAGLWWLSRKRDPAFSDPAQAAPNHAFLLLLFMTSATGLALLAWRESPVMAQLLAVHLGIVMALFLMLPYGKFVHALYRLAALLRYAVERKRPVRDFGSG